MDVFYEESAVNQNAKKGARHYKITHIASVICLVLGILFLVICLFNIPFGTVDSSNQDAVAAYEMAKFICIFGGFQGVFFMLFWFLLSRLKARFNTSFDYCFVSGELRISKVFNVNKRKLVTRIDCADIIQIGDIDNTSYERLRSDPMTKEIVCTPNTEAGKGKFFMYILVNENGKKLYLLECREELLLKMMLFAKRSVLESDYVMQEKKQK